MHWSDEARINRCAGGDSARRGKSEAPRKGFAFGNCVERNGTRFFEESAAKPMTRTNLESSRTHLGNLISDCRACASFTGALSKSISTLLSAEHPDSKESGSRGARSKTRATSVAIRKNGIEAQRRVTKQEKRRELRLRERTILGRKNGLSRGSDRRRRETHRSSWLRNDRKIFSKRTKETTSTGAVGQVVGGSRRQHASR